MTMSISVTLGVRTHAEFGDLGAPAPIIITTNLTDAGDGIDPEDVFVACNRIQSWQDDVAALAADWQVQLRTQLEHHRAPSMSVGDVFCIHDGRGRGRIFIVAPRGFTVGEMQTIEPAAARLAPR